MRASTPTSAAEANFLKLKELLCIQNEEEPPVADQKDVCKKQGLSDGSGKLSGESGGGADGGIVEGLEDSRF
ncbi:MAG: hypothetical protein R2788_26365 [Saprospiraceae bacterium]